MSRVFCGAQSRVSMQSSGAKLEVHATRRPESVSRRLDTIVRYIYRKICFKTYREILCIIVYITFSGGITAITGSVPSAGASWRRRHGRPRLWHGAKAGLGRLAAPDLRLLDEKPRHGYEIIKALDERSKASTSPAPAWCTPRSPISKRSATPPWRPTAPASSTASPSRARSTWRRIAPPPMPCSRNSGGWANAWTVCAGRCDAEEAGERAGASRAARLTRTASGAARSQTRARRQMGQLARGAAAHRRDSCARGRGNSAAR